MGIRRELGYYDIGLRVRRFLKEGDLKGLSDFFNPKRFYVSGDASILRKCQMLRFDLDADKWSLSLFVSASSAVLKEKGVCLHYFLDKSIVLYAINRLSISSSSLSGNKQNNIKLKIENLFDNLINFIEGNKFLLITFLLS